ncbi:tetraspanin-18-like isoform X1 [Haliotis rufescens]|uniref:tetraspanin-18-like isoform X1 n=1 Tax=Haliotis rufescens TaxID=6454 RepID=UPI001EB09290|nr:tetraspanin-18-like isoform X1 [Haliotis rufescens]
MGFCAGCGQCILVLLNVLFLLISLALIVIGVILKFFPGTFMKFLFEGLKATVPFKLPTGTNDLDIVPLVDEIGLALIIIGVTLFGLCFLACCGACCRWRLFLIFYCVCMILLILAVATMGGLFIATDSQLHASIKAQLQQRVHDDYKGPDSSDIFTLAINILSYSMQCCAMGGPDDFNDSAPWTKYTYDGNTFTLQASPACCTDDYLQSNRLDECTQRPFTANRIHTQGCYKKLLNLINEQQTWAILGVVGVVLLLIVQVIFAIVLTKDIGDKKISPI